MKSYGGFLGWERSSGGHSVFPPRGQALASGRSALTAILEKLRPTQLYCPYYTCNAALEPAARLGIPVELYAIDERLRPILPSSRATGSSVLVNNYFGLQGDACVADASANVIIDSTQGYYLNVPGKGWAFNSARKFFGVPDGAWLFAPEQVSEEGWNENEVVSTQHLDLKNSEPHLAYSEYLKAEACVPCEPTRMSALSRKILATVNHEEVRCRRRGNYMLFERALGATNRLRFELGPQDVPLCYPYLPSRSVDRERLIREKLFVPRFWGECLSRRLDGYEWEKELTRNLLPLPIDQRYVDSDCEAMLDILQRSF